MTTIYGSPQTEKPQNARGATDVDCPECKAGQLGDDCIFCMGDGFVSAEWNAIYEAAPVFDPSIFETDPVDDGVMSSLFGHTPD